LSGREENAWGVSSRDTFNRKEKRKVSVSSCRKKGERGPLPIPPMSMKEADSRAELKMKNPWKGLADGGPSS